MTTPEITPISGKDIVILDPPPLKTLAQRLQGLLGELGNDCNTHEKVCALIEACIGDGVTNGSDIIAAIAPLGFNRRYVGMWLARERGSDAMRYSWFKDGDGQYRLHG